LLGAFVVAGVVLLFALIWSFHIQYMQPPSFSLKAPTLLSVFIFIALRALRADSGYVLLAGIVAAAGWTALVAYALAESQPGAITHDFIAYVTSDRILIGAEIEKIIAILTVTIILAVAISRARGLLIRLVTERSAARELSRFFDSGIAARIREDKHHIRAGHGEACEGAILIFDIRGFTALSDHLAPDEVMALLAEYQARLIPIIQNHGGSIDKFLGDGVIATFGVARRPTRRTRSSCSTRPSRQSIVGTRPDTPPGSMQSRSTPPSRSGPLSLARWAMTRGSNIRSSANP
jgi:adenylate cyclase